VIDTLTVNAIAQRYVAAFLERGSSFFISNLATDVRVLQWGQHVLPMTLNDGEPAETFVCSPLVGYLDYPREELARFPNRMLVPALHVLIQCVGGVLALADMNRIVHINNWMISTNLPVDLDVDLVRSQTQVLASQFPQHIIAMRSLNQRYSARLLQELESAGWMLLPSRQVYLVDDVAAESLVRRDSRNDHKIWKSSKFKYEEVAEMNEADAERIVQLYELLYLRKYSRLNPVFTAAFVTLTHRIGMMKYLVLRDGEGVVQGFGAMHHNGKYATMPLIGHDTSLPQSLGLYRLVCHAGSLYAAERRLHLNMSSGATLYKRTRGATPELEFTAYYVGHLPVRRRAPMQALRIVANHIGIPLLKRYEL
jgi:hypothetical protein